MSVNEHLLLYLRLSVCACVCVCVRISKYVGQRRKIKFLILFYCDIMNKSLGTVNLFHSYMRKSVGSFKCKDLGSSRTFMI